MAGLLSVRLVSPLARTLRQSAPKSIALMTVRKISFWRQKSQSAAIETTKSEYEIEYEKFVKKDNYKPYLGFFEDDPVYDRAFVHVLLFICFSVHLVFVPIIYSYGPDFRSRMKEWRKYEAIKLIEEREAKGEIILDMNFVPTESMESMVPPPGDWEEEWLKNQPSVRSASRTKWFTQVPTW
ncbi:uncharacterized protein LOC143461057 [Clavelina lepadiformis]|uniref:NADH dehydrogenase [ubiquinone] 1 beta subcomplex subunit 11, mitochondrial n=1 Tax=Clavelina lepadiformis TaxID=159417 RepID=A0ABP0GE76_CLALP